MCNRNKMSFEKAENNNAAVMWLAMWFGLNVGLTILNKAVFASFSFPYPITLSCVHYIVSGLGAHLCLVMGGIKSAKLDWKGYKGMFMFSVIFNTNILLGNASIKVVSVALSQTVRAIIPATTMLVTYVILGTVYKERIRNAVLPVIFGMVLACYGDVGNFSMLGISILMAGCFASGFKVVVTKVLLSGKDSFHPFDLLSKVTPLCVIQLIPLIYLFEYPSMVINDDIPSSTICMVIMSGFMAFFLNVANFFTNRLVAPLTITIAGNIKQVTTIMISIIIFNTSVTALNGFGILVTLIGGAYYSHVAYEERTNNKNKLSLDRASSKNSAQKELLLSDVERGEDGGR